MQLTEAFMSCCFVFSLNISFCGFFFKLLVWLDVLSLHRSEDCFCSLSYLISYPLCPLQPRSIIPEVHPAQFHINLTCLVLTHRRGFIFFIKPVFSHAPSLRYGVITYVLSSIVITSNVLDYDYYYSKIRCHQVWLRLHDELIVIIITITGSTVRTCEPWLATCSAHVPWHSSAGVVVPHRKAPFIVFCSIDLLLLIVHNVNTVGSKPSPSLGPPCNKWC